MQDAGARWQVAGMRQLRRPARKPAADRAGGTTIYTSAQDFYIYHRPAPPGFEMWLNYAREQRCVLEVYDQIEHDLAPFRELPSLGNRACIQPAGGAQQGMQALDGGLNRVARRCSLQEQRRTSHAATDAPSGRSSAPSNPRQDG